MEYPVVFYRHSDKEIMKINNQFEDAHARSNGFTDQPFVAEKVEESVSKIVHNRRVKS